MSRKSCHSITPLKPRARACLYVLTQDAICGRPASVTVTAPQGNEKLPLCRPHDEARNRGGVIARLGNSFIYLSRRIQ